MKQLKKKLFFSISNGLIFDFSKNLTPRLYILFLIDKSKNIRELSQRLAKLSNILDKL